jgi:hypothetical protein
MTQFTELPEYIKGKIGEGIIKAELTGSGLLVYPAPDGVSEPFDFFVLTPDWAKAYLIDVKTYNRMATVPAISVDTKDLGKYIHCQNDLRHKFLLYFADSFEMAIYRCTLDAFRNTCKPNRHTGKSTAPLSIMEYIRALTLDECRAIGYPIPMYNGVDRWFNDSRIEKQTRR